MSNVICPVCGNRNTTRRDELTIGKFSRERDIYMGTYEYGHAPKDDQFYICRVQEDGCGAVFYTDKIIRYKWSFLIPIDPEMVR